MKKNTQSGFSLIELLLVVTIVGIIAALGVPSLQRGIRAADNGAAFATLRTMSSVELTYYGHNGRFARLDELNAAHNNALGTLSNGGKTLTRGRFVYEMTPLSPSDAELKDGYSITASGTNGVVGVPYIFRVDETGYIDQVLP